jgi:hypothetical protein
MVKELSHVKKLSLNHVGKIGLNYIFDFMWPNFGSAGNTALAAAANKENPQSNPDETLEKRKYHLK